MAKLSIKVTKIVKEIKLKEINVSSEQFNILMFSSLRRKLNLSLSLCHELNDIP